jgi:hypothetical protein
MSYLDWDRLDAIDEREFQNQKPYPWVNPKGCLREEGFRELVATLPDVSMFDQDFGRERRYGQQSHDRYNLELTRDVDVAKPWKDLLEELTGDRYRGFLARLYGHGSFKLRFHWHYTPNGCSVSPHCDSTRKLGSHIFYMNTSDDWDPSWGGETIVLDDGGRLGHRSAPAIEEFDAAISSSTLDNMSFLFQRTAHAWHAVREIRCPEGAMRKVFIVVIDDWRLTRRFLSGRRKRNTETY